MLAKDVLRIVSGALQDLDPGLESRWRWEGGDDGMVGLLDFLNLALTEVVMQRPDATAKNGNLRLDPGLWQRVPAEALVFMGLNGNVGEDGRTPGLPIFPAAPETLLAWASSGMSEKTAWSGVESFAYDRMADPRRFLVYPAVPDDCEARVSATWATRPPHVDNPEECVCLPDTYHAALVHHVLYGVLSGDNEVSNAARAQHHLSTFYQALGVKQQVDVAWPKNTAGTR